MKPDLKEVRLSDVIFDEVVYPRREHDPVLVQRYAECLDEIEAQQKFISVATDLKLLDGKHRWLAYKTKHKDKDHVIRALVYPVTAPHDQLKLAAKLNSDHGWQLTDDDKIATAKTLYAYGCSYDDIADSLSVSKKKLTEWLSRVVKENKDKRDRKIADLWLACWTQTEIGNECDCDQKTVANVIEDFRKTVSGNQIPKAASDHATDFDPLPLYNVWKQQEKTAGSKHYGNSEVRWLDNLLYRYTQPFDVVIDPFGGGGSTIDICRKRFRRYWVSDRQPIEARAEQIRKHDLTEGLPKNLPWKDVRLVYLDPPYWKQAEGQYSEDPTDLANMPMEQFHDALESIISGFLKKLEPGAVVAMLLQPTQWKAPERQYTDHVAEMIRRIKAPIDMRIQAPYESQQCTAQMVEWAKENRNFLVLSREFVIWRKA